jgi:hypothetical protein
LRLVEENCPTKIKIGDEVMMQRKCFSICFVALSATALLALSDMPALASTVVSVSGPDSNGVGISVGSQAGAVSFTTGQSYSDVHIFALVDFGPATGQSFLTTSLGPGTTAADQLASGTFSVLQGPKSTMTDVLNISPLNPGTYFLSLFGQANAGTYGFEYTSSPTTVADTGASVGSSVISIDASASYPPASSFSLTPRGTYIFEVTSDAPEPASIALFGLGSAALFAFKRMRRPA